MGFRINCIILWFLIFHHFDDGLFKVFPGKCPQPYSNDKYISANDIYRNWYVLALLPELEDGESLFKHTYCWVTNKETAQTIGCKYLAMVYKTTKCSRYLLKFCLDDRDIQSRENTMSIMDKDLSLSARHSYFACQDQTKWTHWYFKRVRESQNIIQGEDFILFWGCRNIDNATHNEGAFIFTGGINPKPKRTAERLWNKYLNFTISNSSDLIITENFFSHPCLDNFQCELENPSCNFILSAMSDVHSVPLMGPTKLQILPKLSSEKTIFFSILGIFIGMGILYKITAWRYFRRRRNVAPQ